MILRLDAVFRVIPAKALALCIRGEGGVPIDNRQGQ